METVRLEGGRSVSRGVDHYNLDMILSVGYRDFLKDRAMEHAETEWKRFQKMLADGTHLPAVKG
jgi:hypothetical protein